MQDTEKQLNGIIDLTQNFTIGAKKEYDFDFPLDSPEHYLFNVLDEDKLKMFFEKVNKTDKYYRYSSLEHVVETIFNSSKVKLYSKKKEIDNFLNVFPELKEQKIAELKLDTYKINKIIDSGIKDELQLSIPTDEQFLDLEKAKHVCINDVLAIFLSLGRRSIEDIRNYLLLIIEYRANLLFINYLIELSLPPATKKAEVKAKYKTKTYNEGSDENRKDINDFREWRRQKSSDSEALKSLVKNRGIKEIDTKVFKNNIDRLRKMLIVFGVIKTKENATKKLPKATK